MLATLTLKLRDAPGALLEALKPISSHRGNIISIVHMREQAKRGYVPTAVSFRVGDSEQLGRIVGELEKQCRVMELKTDGRLLEKKASFSVLLYGHVMRTNAKDTLDRLGRAGALISNFSVDIKDRANPSCAIVKLDVEERRRGEVLAELERLAKEKELLVIRE